MKRKWVKTVVIWGTIMAFVMNRAATEATIKGSAHDFSSQGWAKDEICVVCHTPHNASAALAQPLWNHGVTAATFQLYQSDTLRAVPGQPGPASKACLSCHDGTVAIDTFGAGSGSHFMTGSALTGTDLSDDHPIGIKVAHKDVPGCLNCHNLHNPRWVPVLPFFDGKVECASCHEPHNNGVPGEKMLRMTRVDSQICLHCHSK